MYMYMWFHACNSSCNMAVLAATVKRVRELWAIYPPTHNRRGYMMAKPGSQLAANSTKVLETLTWEYANKHVCIFN